MLVELGLDTAKEEHKDENDELFYVPLDGLRVCSIHVPEGQPTGETFTTIVHPARGIAAVHSDKAPTWVSCPDKPALEALLAEHFGCPVGKPADVEETHWTVSGPPGVGVEVPKEPVEVEEAPVADEEAVA
jgi:hypothetical protein